MPGKLKVKILAGRHLPVMDRASDLTDAFVEVKFSNITFKTDVYPKSLNPQWNSEWFKFEVDDEELQDEPLQITVLDHDTYSANDAIGKVYIDIDPLLSTEAASLISGWFPIYDTIHGIRGEINVTIKVDLFNDINRFRQSSCGVKFFSSTCIPRCYRALAVHGFVEELVVNEDPEYQWIDRIRTPRASNEARQRLISQMSGELQRKIGLKVLEMFGNAVVGYLQCFDLEGESGLVVRAIGTACTLEKLAIATTTAAPGQPSPPVLALLGQRRVSQLQTPFPPLSAGATNNSNAPGTGVQFLVGESSPGPQQHQHHQQQQQQQSQPTPIPRDTKEAPFLDEAALLSQSPPLSSPQKAQTTNSFSPIKSFSRQSSSSDTELSLTPKMAGVGSGSGGRDGNSMKMLSRQHTTATMDQLEFPFFTLTSFPPGFLIHVAGVVSARSVKLLDRIHNPEEPETRDAWWAEIRQEIKSHAKALGCHAVVGYSECTSICEEVCILSACGTAAVLSPRLVQDNGGRAPPALGAATAVPPAEAARLSWQAGMGANDGRRDVEHHSRQTSRDGAATLHGPDESSCSFCHVPYDELNLPFPTQLGPCGCCKRHKVPDFLFTTVDPPSELPIIGKGCLVQARLCRQKKKAQGEVNATSISNLLPFMEYELHTQLMNKLKLRGMNALFGLCVSVSIGETMLVGIASATAVFVAALPPPGGLHVAGKSPEPGLDGYVSGVQKRINEVIARNKELYEIKTPVEMEDPPDWPMLEVRRYRVFRSQSESSDETLDLDLSHGKKDAFVLEIDDADAEEDIQALLTDTPTPLGFYICNTETVPGVISLTSDLQMFSAVRVYRMQEGAMTSQHRNKAFNDMCESMLKSLYFKLRSMMPCCLCHVNFSVSLPEDELIQVTVTALAVSFLPDTPRPLERMLQRGSLDADEQLQFSMDLSSDVQRLVTPSNPTGNGEERCNHPTSPDRAAGGERVSPYGEGPSRHRLGSRALAHPLVEMTPLSFLPGCRITKYLGIINVFFIRETTSLREEGGASGFLHTFIAEVFAMVRAHVASLGGNAVVSYRMRECVFSENPNKNQAQCLINVSGDAVHVIRDTEAVPEPVTPWLFSQSEASQQQQQQQQAETEMQNLAEQHVAQPESTLESSTAQP
ncbi:C2 domain-containing protein 5 isoform X4 [Lethenteron reissneri]|uniref:C2 domain-containing protein 5 isoform X4 n=1 Tax=Lethenteron reissneri TaxID=7753 RepID=UPI002AB6BF3F|nr:C2 domain-containing protein 5 isoform X4 [Lethenteron reissneri]